MMNKYQYFWNFFVKSEQQIITLLEEHPEDVVLMMSEQLNKIHPDLAFEIYKDTEKENMTLIVSADGNSELFPLVEDLFNYEVTIKNWDIYKFRTALNEQYQFSYGKGLLLFFRIYCLHQTHMR